VLLRCEKHKKVIHMAGDENESRFLVKENLLVKAFQERQQTLVQCVYHFKCMF